MLGGIAALKGQNMVAQGVALGFGFHFVVSPERARYHFRIVGGTE